MYSIVFPLPCTLQWAHHQKFVSIRTTQWIPFAHFTVHTLWLPTPPPPCGPSPSGTNTPFYVSTCLCVCFYLVEFSLFLFLNFYITRCLNFLFWEIPVHVFFPFFFFVVWSSYWFIGILNIVWIAIFCWFICCKYLLLHACILEKTQIWLILKFHLKSSSIHSSFSSEVTTVAI